MKKQIIFACVCCGWVINLPAQTDITKEFLTNPSFEDLRTTDGTADVTVKTSLDKGLYGWEVASMSNYQVESEESGSSTGFPADGSGKIKPTEGTYYYFNRQGWGNKDSELRPPLRKNCLPELIMPSSTIKQRIIPTTTMRKITVQPSVSK